jgi:predicted nucleic acid-binding protein
VSGYLLDTNVVSELRRSRKDPAVVAWFGTIVSDETFISALVVGEIRKGIERLRQRDAAQTTVLEAWLEQLESGFATRILPVNGAVADRWGRIEAGKPVPIVDGLMAATALVYDLTLVTRNVEHVVGTGARVLNPWAHQ